jgi:hypothetical protein
LAMFVAVVVSLKPIENEFKRVLNATIANINSNETSSVDFESNCTLSLEISKLFRCCGASGPSDFQNQTLVTQKVVCWQNTTDGCDNQLISLLESTKKRLIVKPNVVLLIVELSLVVAFVPCIIYGTKKQRMYSSF